jgi:carboxylate-amine ligase
MFPRCGVHEPFGDFATYADFVELLARTGSVTEATQLWWSVRPHHRFGTVEFRICDAQTRGPESLALASLITACIAQAALDFDEGTLPSPLRHREIEENLWRAIRNGLEGTMIDFASGDVVPTRETIEELVAWTGPARAGLGLEVEVPDRNGAMRGRAALADGLPIEDVYRESVEDTRRTYAPELTGVRG